MPKHFFQFKQFLINQDRCAMKVCTDSCLFGAYVKINTETKRILDIGTGTGLLALMIAQRASASIDAVEIESTAAEQAELNIQKSPWNNRIRIYKQSIQDFTYQASTHYDLIISNPPFFNNYLKSPDKNINTAHHTGSLSFEDLITCVHKLLAPEGVFWLMLPPYESEIFIHKVSKVNLYLNEKLNIRDKPDLEITRIISLFSFQKNTYVEKELFIKDNNGNYTSDFIRLLKDYYLHLD